MNDQALCRVTRLIGHVVTVRLRSGLTIEGTLTEVDIPACMLYVRRPNDGYEVNALFVEFVKDCGKAESADVGDL